MIDNLKFPSPSLIVNLKEELASRVATKEGSCLPQVLTKAVLGSEAPSVAVIVGSRFVRPACANKTICSRYTKGVRVTD